MSQIEVSNLLMQKDVCYSSLYLDTEILTKLPTHKTAFSESRFRKENVFNENVICAAVVMAQLSQTSD